MSEWLAYPENKPLSYCSCFVKNIKGWLYCEKALYYPNEDVFIEDNPNKYQKYPLAITHYLPIPPCADECALKDK